MILAVPEHAFVSVATNEVGGDTILIVIEVVGDEYADKIPKLDALIWNVYALPGVSPEIDAVLPEIVKDPTCAYAAPARDENTI